MLRLPYEQWRVVIVVSFTAMKIISNIQAWYERRQRAKKTCVKKGDEEDRLETCVDSAQQLANQETIKLNALTESTEDWRHQARICTEAQSKANEARKTLRKWRIRTYGSDKDRRSREVEEKTNKIVETATHGTALLNNIANRDPNSK